MKIKLVLFLVALICGNAWALPQDWPCEMFTLSFVGKNPYGGDTFEGVSGSYKVTLPRVDWIEDTSRPDCGNAGCSGSIEQIETGRTELLRFWCSSNETKTILNCTIMHDDEFLLTKVLNTEYRAPICDYYQYVDVTQCKGCTCILKDSRNESTDRKVNCVRESETQLRCFTPYGYEAWRNYRNHFDDYNRCVQLGL